MIKLSINLIKIDGFINPVLGSGEGDSTPWQRYRSYPKEISLIFHLQKIWAKLAIKWMSYGHFSAATYVVLKIWLDAYLGQKNVIGSLGLNFGAADPISFVTYT